MDQLTYGYQAGTNRLSSLSDAASGGAPTPALWDAESGALSYDANGNATVLPAPYLVTATTYDPRSLPVVVTGQEREVRYRYSASGQRYSVFLGNPFARQGEPGSSASPAPATRAAAPGSAAPRAADGAQGDRPRRYGARFGRSVGTDGAGSPGAGASASASSTTYYALDALGRSGTQPSVAVRHEVEEGGPVRLEWNLLTPSGEVVGREIAGSLGSRRYYHKDLLGSVRVAESASGSAEQGSLYDGWGVELLRDGLIAGEPLVPVREGFTGKEREAEVGGALAGLDYFGARLYAPLWGRFTSVDPLLEKHPDVSPYAYVLNNPLALVDPDGRQVRATGPNLPVATLVIPRREPFWTVERQAHERAAVESLRHEGQGIRAALRQGMYYISRTGDALAQGVNALNRSGGFIDIPGPAAITSPAATGVRASASSLLTASRASDNAAAGVGRSVIGHYPAYVHLSDQLGARRFNIPTEVWNGLSGAERWAANQRFLDRAIARSDEFLLATPLAEVTPGSYYQRELNYLFGKGYVLSDDGARLLSPQH